MDLPARIELVTIQEVARVLRVSRTHVYKLVELGQLPAVRFGRNVRVRPCDLEQFVLDHLTGSAGNEAGE